MKMNKTSGHIAACNTGLKTQVYYRRPTGANDLKREGRYMEICTNYGKNILRLDGKQINSIKQVLASVGEVSIVS